MCLIALNPGFLFQILSRIIDVSPKLQNKVWNRKLGFKASVWSELLKWFLLKRSLVGVSLLCVHTAVCLEHFFATVRKEGQNWQVLSIDHQVSLASSLKQGLLSSVQQFHYVCMVLLQGVKEKTKSLWSYINSQVDRSQYFVYSLAPSGSISSTVVCIPAVGSRAHNDIVFITMTSSSSTFWLGMYVPDVVLSAYSQHIVWYLALCIASFPGLCVGGEEPWNEATVCIAISCIESHIATKVTTKWAGNFASSSCYW